MGKTDVLPTSLMFSHVSGSELVVRLPQKWDDRRGCLLLRSSVTGSRVFTCVPACFAVTQLSQVRTPPGQKQVCCASASMHLPSEGSRGTGWGCAWPHVPLSCLLGGRVVLPVPPLGRSNSGEAFRGHRGAAGGGGASVCPQERAFTLLPSGRALPQGN